MKWPPKQPKPRVAGPIPTDKARLAGLSPEERQLWRHVAASVEPIKTKPSVRRAGPNEPEPDGPAVPHRRPSQTEQATAIPQKSSFRDMVQRRTTAIPPPELADFDARKAKKLGSGRADIDARLDLHGLRQDEALGRLRRFLQDCHAHGLKTVLVITGKGRETDDPATPFVEMLERHPRGVLRRNVPRWLDAPELRTFVVSYTTAAQRHGGEGAFYVQLRRHGRSK